MAVITISGKIGSGALEIGKVIAEKLHFDYLDRQIIAEVASRLHLQEQEVLAKENPPTTFQERIAEALARGYAIGDGIQGTYLPIGQIPLDDKRYVDALTSFIKDISKQNVVIMGRGSQYILKDDPKALHLAIIAPFKLRLNRFMKEAQLTEELAKQRLNHLDNIMKEFMKRFFNADGEELIRYHMMINTEWFSYEEAITLILQAINMKEPTAIS